MFYKELLSFVLFLVLPMSKGAVPGTFFWRPRLGIDLVSPTKDSPVAAHPPNKDNIQAGLVVIIEGYDILTSILGLLKGVEFASDDETMDPGKAIYYTGVYRWILRTINLFPHWFKGNFNDALSVWKNRFKYMDAEVPPWLREAMPWIKKKNWETDKANMLNFRKHSEVSFTKYYRFPSKTYTNFASFVPDSAEQIVFSSEGM